MFDMSYPAVFTQEADGGFSLQFPDMPEGISQGDTEEDARMNASDCLFLTIYNRLKRNEPIPIPSYHLNGPEYRWIYPKIESVIRYIMLKMAGIEFGKLKDDRWPNIYKIEKLLNQAGYQFILDVRKY